MSRNGPVATQSKHTVQGDAAGVGGQGTQQLERNIFINDNEKHMFMQILKINSAQKDPQTSE